MEFPASPPPAHPVLPLNAGSDTDRVSRTAAKLANVTIAANVKGDRYGSKACPNRGLTMAPTEKTAVKRPKAAPLRPEAAPSAVAADTAGKTRPKPKP